MNKTLIVISMLVISFSSFHARVKAWNKKLISKYIKDERVVELIVAANKGKVHKIDELVSRGVDVNYRGKDNYTPLYIQFFSKNLKGFRSLLEHGADPTIPVADGTSVIWGAAIGGDGAKVFMEELKLCLEHGGDPNWVYHHRYSDSKCLDSDDGDPLIISAIVYNENVVEALRLLVTAGADVNATGEVDLARFKPGSTALATAANLDKYDAVLFLLKHGADYLKDSGQKISFLDLLEKYPVMTNRTLGYQKKQCDYRAKVVEFLKQKGIAVHLKHPDCYP